MKWMRGLWAGACLLLVLSGCAKEPTGSIKDAGVFSPLITGISADHEPAIRDTTNEFTAIVTNVSGLPITYHWSAVSGEMTDSTGATAVWKAPNAVGTYPVTVSIVSGSYFKTMTFQVFVDNEYTRWTRSADVQFDASPITAGGVLFAQFRNIATGAADVYSLSGPGLSPVQLTQNFATITSPSMQADGGQIAFAGRRTTSDSVAVWLLPGTGGDPSMAVAAEYWTSEHPTLGNPRFARTGRWLLYNQDSLSAFNPKPWFRDADLNTPQQHVLQLGAEGISTFWMPAWGPDTDGNSLPDSIVCPAYYFFGATNQRPLGLFKFATTPEQPSAVQWLPDSSATDVDWSADGNYILYTKPNAVSGDRDIWIINAGSSDPRTAKRVTTGPADDSRPRFSPDGKTIFFVSNRVDHYGLNGIYNTERRGTNIWTVTKFDRP
jgi:WD40-like Beta Propeller Repeat